jgi:hypothetical protein
MPISGGRDSRDQVHTTKRDWFIPPLQPKIPSLFEFFFIVLSCVWCIGYSGILFNIQIPKYTKSIGNTVDLFSRNIINQACPIFEFIWVISYGMLCILIMSDFVNLISQNLSRTLYLHILYFAQM